MKSKLVFFLVDPVHTCTTLLHYMDRMRDHHKSAPDEQKHKVEIPQELKKIAAIG